MLFSSCHPLLKDILMLELFQSDVFKIDEYFYIVVSEITDRELQDVILMSQEI